MDYSATAQTFRQLALNEDAKAYVLDRPELYQPMYRAASRYIGGETLDSCLAVAQEINRQGHAVTIDFMGESTRGREQVAAATAEFLNAAGAIDQYALNASVSLDLSHIGLVVDEGLCLENASAIAEAAGAAGTEVMISAEGIDRTDAVHRVHGQLCERFEHVGITIQAFLHRSPRDLEVLLSRPGKVRVVKGAFDAPAGHTMQRGSALNAAYLALVRSLLGAKHPCSIATHDPEILNVVVDETQGTDAEFAMLRGVAIERLDELRDRGLSTRVYLPYGYEWFLYLLNRLAEHPPSLFDAISAAVAANETA
ncbi:MAG: proline dehydrogenase family protein [Bacteroidota bacterium]